MQTETVPTPQAVLAAHHAEGRPAPEEAVRLLKRHFLNRTDVLAVFGPRRKALPVKPRDLDELLFGHVLGEAASPAHVTYAQRRATGAMSGHYRAGAYAPSPDGTTRWLCLDFDGSGHGSSLTDPRTAAVAASHAFADADLPAYLERSGGGRGWRLWCFFETPQPAARVQAVGRLLTPRNARCLIGGLADPGAGRGIELHPKQHVLRGRSFGSAVWLPWWSGAAAGGNVFYERKSDDLRPLVPGEFELASPDRLERALAGSAPMLDDDVSGASSEAWRRRALAALPIESVYGPWLAGRTAEHGWLECRDACSPRLGEGPCARVADGTGQAERGTFHSPSSGRTLSVFDFLVTFGGTPDLAAARERIAELSGVPLPREPGRRQRSRSRPEIQVNNRPLDDIVDDAWAALVGANRPPVLFRRSRDWVRIENDEKEAWLEPIDETGAISLLAEVATWLRVAEHGVTYVSPPREVARVVTRRPRKELPPIESIVTTPVFDATGHLVLDPGYHADACLWHQPRVGFEIEPLPENPTADDVSAAVRLFTDDLLVDFPFAAESDRAHAFGAFLLPFVRRMIAGATPIHLVEAPTPGTGKSILGDLVAIVATGRSCEPTTLTRDEDETRKKITSLLVRGQSVLLLDNIREGIDSAQLAAAITAEQWSDRLLGQSRMLVLPNHATWIATANNPQLSLEIARRCVRIRLDPKTDRPWLRTTFKHTPIRDWARRNRARLVRALLLLVRAWLAEGRPRGSRVLGSFESWAEVIGGILEHAGVHGFLEDAEKLYEAADREGNEWRAFVAVWHERFGANPVTAQELVAVALERELLVDVVGDKSLHSQASRLGRALHKARDRQFDQLRIEMVGRLHNVTRWRTVVVTTDSRTDGAPT